MQRASLRGAVVIRKNVKKMKTASNSLKYVL